MKKVLFYTTAGCHLCEQAEAMLQILCQELAINSRDVEVVDISESDDLVERYGVRIPVIGREGTDSELGWPFDLETLYEYLAAD